MDNYLNGIIKEIKEHKNKIKGTMKKTIYRLTEYDLNNQVVKILYSEDEESLEEERDSNESDSQHIDSINFNGESLKDLCSQLNILNKD